MKFWQCLAMIDMDELPVLAKHAEDLGFEGITLGEHLITFSEQYEQYDYSKNSMIRWYPHTHWPDPWVQTTLLASCTKTLKFLNSLYVLPMRDPFNAAKTISTVENLFPGRIMLGAGIGWQKSEFDIVGQDFHTRGKRTDEMIDVMKQLWTGLPVEHHGEFYDFPRLQMSPGLKAELPIVVGGFSPAALRRAAHNDGWIGGQHDMADVEAMVSGLKTERLKLGREMENFHVAVGLYEATKENFQRCEELGVTILYREAFCDKNGMASTMTLDEKLRDMEAFANQHLV